MSYDLSRKNFNPLDDYFGVVMQQGRVQLDADWNTLVDQFKRHIQTESMDTFGPSVVPRETADGFLISTGINPFEIGPGRIYVDGLLAENHTDTLKWDPRLAELSATAKLSGANIDAAPSGLSGSTTYTEQPYYPFPPTLPDGGNYLVYVDVWQRDVSYLQDANLIDVAVGVDTTARQQTVWQVKFLENDGNLDATVNAADIPGWLETIHPSSARLSTATGDLVDDDNPCLLPPQAGYKGLENQLYRVQVHDAGPVGTATFKWSRDNAVVATRVSAIPGANEIVVESLGRDDILSFQENDWVEITDDYRDFMGQAGELRRIQVGGINTATRTIILEGDALPIGSAENQFQIDGDNQTIAARNTRLIRWDQAGIVFREDEAEYADLNEASSSGTIEIPNAGTRLFLEKGILVDFALENVVTEADFEAEFKVGDYWIFSARVNDASIELLEQSPPMGIHHHYSKLAIVNGDNTTDCRTLWPTETGGNGCACTVCVTPESHNNGTATIQQAIDQVNSEGGGTVCLSVGSYHIDQAIRITGNSVTLRGQGWQTALISRKSNRLIDIGGDTIATNITVENLLALTTVARSFNSAITVNNVFGLNLNHCFIANIALESGTSQAIQFSGLAVMVKIKQCQILAEQGITGPRLKDDFLATMDFAVNDCLFECKQHGISFSGLSFHISQLLFSDNHISNARNIGIELTGITLDNTAVDIKNNLLKNCHNGIRTGIPNLRISCNDLQVERGQRTGGSAIIFVEGLVADDTDNLQIIGNRIRNYSEHAITVQAAVGKMMVKQNQIENIFGAAFIIDTGGSVEYLTLENNQFTNIDGVIQPLQDRFAAVFLQASIRADITNNVFDSVVRNTQSASTRAAIDVSSSADVRITGNRLFAVTPANYSGVGIGILISSKVGSFQVNDNEISRIPENDGITGERLVPVFWLPLIVLGAETVDANAATGRVSRGNSFANLGAFASFLSLTNNTPVVNVSDKAYALGATNLISLGASAQANNSVTVNANHFDATSTTTYAAIISMPTYCGFIDNEVKSTNSDMVALISDQVAANNNRLITSKAENALIIQSRGYVVMGNMTAGKITIIENGTAVSLPAPWSSLNIFI